MKLLKAVEPYRLFFPFGVLFGVLGVYLWIAFAFFPGSEYPVPLHSKLMLGAFLFSFAAGFLMTAVPKMTASRPAQPFEILMAFFLVFANAICAYTTRVEFSYFTAAISVLSLLIFFASRFFARTKAPPPFFPFVFMGLFIGFVGSLLLSLNAILEIPTGLLIFSKKIYFEGMILFLVLGIGSRLIPVISGRGVAHEKNGRIVVIQNFLLGTGLVMGFALESSSFVLAGGLLKCVIATWIAIFGWNIFAKSKTKSRLALAMRVSGFMILLGLYMTVLQPVFAVHWMHMTYIAGFGLMALTIATRVTLAHGSYDLAYESKSYVLWICAGLILMAAATRVVAPYLAAGYVKHLGYAAIVWIAALLLWAAVFVKKILATRKPASAG